MKLEPLKLVSKELKLSFISLVILVEIYPVVLAHESCENLKWKLGHRFALNANYSIFDMFFWHLCPKYPVYNYETYIFRFLTLC